ncbi:hypothetical protein IIB34_08800, partial [PVC group bacterium]|nr:hypothetical protein [PVC group bacterium]
MFHTTTTSRSILTGPKFLVDQSIFQEKCSMNDLAKTNTNGRDPDRQDVPAVFMPFYAAGWCCRQVADAMEEAKEGSKASPEGKRRKKHWIKRNVASR